ncbi:NUDIX domain-containing protein [Paenibacillus sp. FSL R5-0407]|uniref:NUDIX domain-containing protein n=1 Tax=Paenibacillus sp. FSL R5-0407 TaxID=2975320 RepID=UPI0030FACAA4
MKTLDYISANAEVGVGLELRLRTGQYVFFLPGIRHMRDEAINEVFYAGIGGHLEPGEDLLECGKREAQEEIGLSIEYEGSKSTVYIDSNKNIRTIEVDDSIKPLAIFEMIHPDGSPKPGGIYHIVVFKALIDIEPHRFQIEEVSGLILLNKEQMLNGNRRATIQQLLDEGAKVIGSNISMETVIYPIGTAEALTLIR